MRTIAQARKTVQYYQNILDSPGLIGYWMLDEKQGTVAYDQTTLHQLGIRNGAHTGVTLAQPGIGDGRTAPYYDGTNDFTNIFSASLQGIFNGAEGTCLVWAKVQNSGVWTDGAFRIVAILRSGGGNYIDILKWNANNQLTWRYSAGGILEQVNLEGVATTDFFTMALTWSAAADEVRAYYNGIQTGATQVGLGVWAGALAAGNTMIGAFDGIPTSPWNGYIQHVALWNRPLTPQELA